MRRFWQAGASDALHIEVRRTGLKADAVVKKRPEKFAVIFERSQEGDVRCGLYIRLEHDAVVLLVAPDVLTEAPLLHSRRRAASRSHAVLGCSFSLATTVQAGARGSACGARWFIFTGWWWRGGWRVRHLEAGKWKAFARARATPAPSWCLRVCCARRADYPCTEAECYVSLLADKSKSVPCTSPKKMSTTASNAQSRVCRRQRARILANSACAFGRLRLPRPTFLPGANRHTPATTQRGETAQHSLLRLRSRVSARAIIIPAGSSRARRRRAGCVPKRRAAEGS